MQTDTDKDGMMGRIFTSWELMKQSFQILKADKELMWLPVFSAISCLLLTSATVAGGYALFYPGLRDAIDAGGRWHPDPALLSGATFVFYLVNYFTIVFFNTALVGAATIRLQGGDPTLEDGLRLAWRRRWIILQWAAVAATVGMILRMIEQRASLIGRFVVGLIGLAWTLASFLVVPVLAYEDVGPVEALRRSAELFRKTWGEQVVAGFSFGLISLLLAVPGIMLPLMGHLVGGEFGLIIGTTLLLIYIVLLSVVISAARGIFLAALYRYATTGEVAPGYYRQNFTTAWGPKGSW